MRYWDGKLVVMSKVILSKWRLSLQSASHFYFPIHSPKSFIYLPLIPIPISSRLLYRHMLQWAPRSECLSFSSGGWGGLGGLGWDQLSGKFHTQSGDEVHKGGRVKVEGVSRRERERVRRRVWDCCFRVVCGLNERRMRVKCSIYVAIKSLVWSTGPRWAKSHQSLPIWIRTNHQFPSFSPSSFRPLLSSPLLSLQTNRHSGSGSGTGCP